MFSTGEDWSPYSGTSFWLLLGAWSEKEGQTAGLLTLALQLQEPGQEKAFNEQKISTCVHKTYLSEVIPIDSMMAFIFNT